MHFLAVYIPEEKINDIKNSADIVDIISETVVLKKSGKNYLGLCPFHSEKTPSFTVSPDKQIFYCFGCNAGGNVFSFLMKQEGISFPEAARMLARRYGIDIPVRTMSPEQKKRISERESVLAINRQAMDFFCRALLENASGKKAMEYLLKRGISREIIDDFKLGYAPEGWDNLAVYFSKNKQPDGLVEKSGLIIPRKGKSGFYDRFRSRIIFPIFDISMQVIGFGGRVMDDSLPKYLNSPETHVYNKSRSLYGLHMAKGKCRESETVFIVEGYFDLLALHQHGIQNSVATLGTSLTPKHVQILRGFIGKNGRIVLVYDSDMAGIKAAQRTIEVFDKGYVDAHIVVLPDGHDPDSYLLEFGAEPFTKLAAESKGVISFLIDCAVKKHGLSTEGKIRIISDMKVFLAAINDNVARSLYVKELAERIGIDETAVLEKVREAPAGRRLGVAKPAADYVLQNNGNRLERRIIAMMLQFPEVLPEVDNRGLLNLFEDNILKSIGQFILDRSGKPASELMTIIDDKNKKSIIASLVIGDDLWDRDGCLKLVAQFESSRYRNERKLSQEIKDAEERNDYELALRLLKKKQMQIKKAK
ncbi:MAG: DNA primase [Desulfobacterales bacterium]|uniref:DNA primase n=1 Tax=Candidatus Desulfaltia bathyphila TaxID=2841697 RepID=A0A8J6N7H6_9BACT|nr:DNA primase [Candidatus Desulfaltia bathyphila]MBL7195246.1 DNA primase [Desulfobacterales bacterium]MBL7208095.1 DNA primase [Desulfobacterales bacterium]